MNTPSIPLSTVVTKLPNGRISGGGAAVGLDVGTDAVRCLRASTDGRLTVRRHAAAYVVIPPSKSATQLLAASGIPTVACGPSTLVIGEPAVEAAEAFGVPLVPAFPDGELPQDDPVGRQVVALLIESTLGSGSGVCGLSLPGDRDDDRPLENFLANVVSLAGYRPLLAHSAAAAGLVLHESTALTGLTIDFGASGVDASWIERGREVWHASRLGGGRQILAAVADAGRTLFFDREGHAYRDLTSALSLVCESEIGASHQTPASRHLRTEITSLIEDVCRPLEDVANRAQQLGATLPVALTGGLASVPGLTGLFATGLAKVDPAGVLSPVANDPRDGLTVARGLLTLAELETPRLAAAA